MSYNIINALQRLGASFHEKDGNEEGWLLTKAFYRKDNNPSLGLNIKSGSFIDHGTGQRGSIIDLVVLSQGLTRKEAYEFVNGKGSSNGKSIPETETFWSQSKTDWLIAAKQNLINSAESELVKYAKEYDGLEFETLINFGCGITSQFGYDWLVFPYETGAQFYRREDGKKKISALEGSKPKESFFGKNQLQGKDKLIIAKSPRECMLYKQILGDTFVVQGISSGEVGKLSQSQRIYLKYLLKRYKKVYVSFDRDDYNAEQTAFSFARDIRDIDNSYGLDIILLDFGKLTDGDCKDFTDLQKSRYSSLTSRLFESNLNCSDYIWNSVTEQNKIWQIEENGAIHLDPYLLTEVLGNHDFCKIYYKDVPIPIMVKIDDNILSEPSGYQLDQYVKDHLLGKYSRFIDAAQSEKGTKYANISKLNRAYYKYAKELLKPDYKVHLKKQNVEFLSDSKETAYLFYSGKVVKVTKDSVNEINYSELKGALWESQLIERRFTLSQSKGTDGEIAKLVSNVSDGDHRRITSLESHIGYMLHSYKDPAKGKAVIFIDEKIGLKGSANGGTGKGIVAEAIGKIRKKAYIDGKIFDPKIRFAYQDIRLGDQFVHIDDIKEDLEFNYFFPAITNDLSVEPKGKNRFTIPFAYSPKFLLTTNHPIGGNSDSYQRRQSIVEFAPYYSKEFTPEDEFGHTLFNDWDEKEWNRFDNYMVHCLQVYLQNGLITYDINYTRKQFAKNTHPQFVEWADKYLEIGVKYDLAELFRGNRMFPGLKDADAPCNSEGVAFNSFLSRNGDVLEASQATTFNRWVKQYVIYMGWSYNDWESNSKQLITFRK